MSLTENPIARLRGILSTKAMGFFSKGPRRGIATSRVAIDIGHSHLLVLAVEMVKERPEISYFRLENRPIELEGVSECLQKIFQEGSLDRKNVRVALRGQGVIIRILTFPQMKRGDFSSAIRYEVEKYIPFKANEVLLDFQILSENVARGGSRVMEVLLVAVKQAEVYQLLRILQNADIETGMIDVSAFSVANFIEHVLPGAVERTVGFLDMGAETTTLGILSQRKPTFIREISFGGGDILKLLKRRLNLEGEALLNLLQSGGGASSECQAIVTQCLEGFVTELKLSLGYYSSHVAEATPVEEILAVGGGSRFITNLKQLGEEIRIPVRRPEVLSHIGIREGLDQACVKKNEDLLPVVLGLCLRP